jgi:hypothetical protein
MGKSVKCTVDLTKKLVNFKNVEKSWSTVITQCLKFVPALAGRDGLRVLLRVLRHLVERGSEAGCPLVPKEPQRPR